MGLVLLEEFGGAEFEVGAIVRLYHSYRIKSFGTHNFC